VQGSVKFYNEQQGWGFIAPDGGGYDVFFHFSAIVGKSGYRTASEGERVEFDVQQRGDSGAVALNVRSLG
jgi:cold shock protein